MRLTLERLSKQFKNRIAVENVNAELTEGIYGFLGANGAGKTTLMQMICGIVAPTSGEVKLNGKNVTEMGEQFRDLLGYLPQEFGYTPGFTAEDFLLYIASVKGLDPRYARRRTRELMKLVSLEGDMKRKIRTFSGGMKRRLGIAQAILHDPKVLIVDEPTAGLDPEERVRFRNLLSEIAVIDQGRILFRGTVEELLSLVEGRVYRAEVSRKELDRIRSSYNVTSMITLGNNVKVRFLADTEPFSTAQHCDAGVEDAYMYLMQREGAPLCL